MSELSSVQDKEAFAEELSLHELAAKIARETLGTAAGTSDAELESSGVKQIGRAHV